MHQFYRNLELYSLRKSDVNSSRHYSLLIQEFQFKMGHSGDAVIQTLESMEGIITYLCAAAGKEDITYEDLIKSLVIFSLSDRTKPSDLEPYHTNRKSTTGFCFL